MMAWGVVPEQGWRKRPWTPEEDMLLTQYINLHGEGRWSSIARSTGLSRSGKSCRLRWVNYLRPGLKRSQITPQEEAIIIELHAIWGNKWSTIARYLPGRTDNEIKNYWRTHFRKKEKSSQKQEKRNAQILKMKQDQKKVLCYTEAATAASEDDGKITEVAPQEREDMVFMYPTLDDQCLPVMMVHEEANQMDDDFLWDDLWNLEDNFDISNKINSMQNQSASNYAFGVDSGGLWNGAGYIF